MVSVAMLSGVAKRAGAFQLVFQLANHIDTGRFQHHSLIGGQRLVGRLESGRWTLATPGVAGRGCIRIGRGRRGLNRGHGGLMKKLGEVSGTGQSLPGVGGFGVCLTQGVLPHLFDQVVRLEGFGDVVTTAGHLTPQFVEDAVFAR